MTALFKGVLILVAVFIVLGLVADFMNRKRRIDG